MEISSFSFPSQKDFNFPPLSNFIQQELDFPPTPNNQTMSKKIKIDDFDYNPVDEILNKFLGLENSVENHTLFNFKNQENGLKMNEHVSVSCTKRARENKKNIASVIQQVGFGEDRLYSDVTPTLEVRETVFNRHSAESDAENVAIASSKLLQQRRLWVKNRSKAWWEQCNSPDFPEEEFKRAFRMSKSTFNLICSELESVVTKKDTVLRLAIPVRQRVAVCIWRLAMGAPLREVSKRFGLGISTCHKVVLEVCTAIKDVLMGKFVQWPDDIKIEEVKREFEILSGIQNVSGSMYTTHVPIIAPKENITAYFNKRHTERYQKTSYSVTIQGVVDLKGIFTDVCIGWPGSMTNDQVLEKSALFERANRGNLKDIWVVGNSGFPLTDWILVSFTHQNLTWTQHAFNEKVSDVEKVAKDAFMRLKARWSCLQKRTEVKLQDLPVVLGACCVLHNICEIRGEELSEDLRFDLFDDEVVPENIVRSVNAMQARDQIAHKLLHHNHAGTNFL